jgi:hypothetical protein
VTTNVWIDFASTWAATADDLDGVNWTAPSYNHSAWEYTGPGLLWASTEFNCPSGNPAVPEPLNTCLPLDPVSSVPYTTYYFLTSFTATNAPGAQALLFRAYVADGAVFYLNGTEIYRERMPSGQVFNATPATAFPPCNSDGDPTCPDLFVVGAPLATNLVQGNNVLAVEVHTCAISAAVDFGLWFATTNAFAANPPLNWGVTNGTLTLSWTTGGFTLQQAGALTGPWTNTPGPVISSPYTNALPKNGRLFYRLKK